jgi:hypothetical protein
MLLVNLKHVSGFFETGWMCTSLLACSLGKRYLFQFFFANCEGHVRRRWKTLDFEKIVGTFHRAWKRSLLLVQFPLSRL